jgi:hypothetical protein
MSFGKNSKRLQTQQLIIKDVFLDRKDTGVKTLTEFLIKSGVEGSEQILDALFSEREITLFIAFYENTLFQVRVVDSSTPISIKNIQTSMKFELMLKYISENSKNWIASALQELNK